MIGFKEIAAQLFDPSILRIGESADAAGYGEFERGTQRIGVRNFSDAQRRSLYQRDLKEAMRLFKRTLDGDEVARFQFKHAMRGGFREALSISDFPTLFGDIIDRSILANYKETPFTYDQWCKLEEVNDFRVARRIRVDYGTRPIPILSRSRRSKCWGRIPRTN